MGALVHAPMGAAAGSAMFLAPSDGATFVWSSQLDMSVQWADIDATHAYAVRVDNNDPAQSGQFCAWDPGQLAVGRHDAMQRTSRHTRDVEYLRVG
jgi:hypothetical protein